MAVSVVVLHCDANTPAGHDASLAPCNRERSLRATEIRIGTRGSPLALAQAYEVRDKLAAAHAFAAGALPIVEILTSGDRIQDRPLSEVGGKGLFTKEIEVALREGAIDVAVHSMKDLETEMPDGLALSSVLEREDFRDAFLSREYGSLNDMPAGAIIGTSSLRRRAQARHIRPDLKVVEFRGNVQTRLRKLDEGIADATFLACAGLHRLGLKDSLPFSPMPTQVMLPAVAQGAIALQIRADDIKTADALAPLDHAQTRITTTAERAFLATLDGSCRTPIAGLATIDGDTLTFHGQILRPDGRAALATERRGAPSEAEAMGVDAARELLSKAGTDFFTSTAP